LILSRRKRTSTGGQSLRRREGSKPLHVLDCRNGFTDMAPFSNRQDLQGKTFQRQDLSAARPFSDKTGPPSLVDRDSADSQAAAAGGTALLRFIINTCPN
jgi:hypothetical protein